MVFFLAIESPFCSITSGNPPKILFRRHLLGFVWDSIVLLNLLLILLALQYVSHIVVLGELSTAYPAWLAPLRA